VHGEMYVAYRLVFLFLTSGAQDKCIWRADWCIVCVCVCVMMFFYGVFDRFVAPDAGTNSQPRPAL